MSFQITIHPCESDDISSSAVISTILLIVNLFKKLQMITRDNKKKNQK